MTESKPAGVFVQLLAAELQALKRTAKTMHFHAGELIFEQGDPGDGIYVVESGQVEISALISGQQRRVLSRLEPGSFFGEMAVLDNQTRSATATAATETLLSFIPAGEMWSALEHSPQLVLSLMREFSERMRQIDQRFLEEVLQAERLALVGRFAQSIVHDFKNPLNMIGFAADVAASEGASPEIRSEAKAIIRKQVDRLANMTNELLEFTRGSSGSVTRQPVDYAAFIREALEEIRAEARERHVNVDCENDPPNVALALDRKRLLHVLFNLINNAIDMMPEGGRITLRFAVGDTEVTTEVEDTGPGIAPEIAARLFEPFATHGKTHGTGLGLSICKRIIEDHRGRILARSEPGRGAIFSFILPREA
jgi:signal transduction histidine kinase